MAAPIILGNGESWTSAFATVCAQVSSSTPCGGATVVVNAHPAWQDASLTNPLAQWVAYADTGYQGAVLAPRAGSAGNLNGQTPIMEIIETFTGAAGAPLNVRFWADDTLAVFLNGVQVKAPVFGQDTCANAPIGCEPNEFWDLISTTTGGLDTLRLVAYQVGTGTDTGLESIWRPVQRRLCGSRQTDGAGTADALAARRRPDGPGRASRSRTPRLSVPGD